MADPWLLEGAMLASCYVVGMGVAAATVLQGNAAKKKKNRRKTRSGGTGSSIDSSSTAGTQLSRSSLGTTNGASEDPWAGTLGEELPLCPMDADCMELNDPLHYQFFAHTCRLDPCYHAHVEKHCHYFRHSEGQCLKTSASAPASSSHHPSMMVAPDAAASPSITSGEEFSPDSSANGSTFGSTGPRSAGGGGSPRNEGGAQRRSKRGGGGGTKGRPPRNPSVSDGILPSQSLISPNVPNAVQLGVRSECSGKKNHGASAPHTNGNPDKEGYCPPPDDDAPYNFYIWGDWTKVRVHALKRYFHQVTGVPPQRLRVFIETATTVVTTSELVGSASASSGGGGDLVPVATELEELDDLEVVASYLEGKSSGGAKTTRPQLVLRKIHDT